MRILLVKTSSLGDVIHNLPVVSDLVRAHPGITIDWCVEEAFAEIPRLHPGVGEVIPVALRRWRRQADVSDFGQPTAAMTRWRVSVLPSSPLPVSGVGRARWRVELLRARAGESVDLELEACDGTGHLGLPADVAGGSAAAAGQHAFG